MVAVVTTTALATVIACKNKYRCHQQAWKHGNVNEAEDLLQTALASLGPDGAAARQDSR